jgi:hypothetical protein
MRIASKDAAPVPDSIIVDNFPPLNNGFSGPSTREGSTPVFDIGFFFTHFDYLKL